MRTKVVLLLIVAVAVTACSAASVSSAGAATPSPGSASPTASPTSVPTPTATASPTPTTRPTRRPTATPEPSRDAALGRVVVTFRTAGDEEYRVLLTHRDDIALARRLLAGEEDPLIPHGRLVRGGDGGVNIGYSWHIDPDMFEFAQFTVELCDGRPSYVEDGTHSTDYFCPWSAVVVAIAPAS
jgi:hypothetical protein